MLHRLNLILNSNQGLALFRQKEIPRSNGHDEDFFIQLFNAWLLFTSNNFPNPTSIEKILDQTICLNPHAKLHFSSDDLFSYCIPSRIMFQTNLA